MNRSAEYDDTASNMVRYIEKLYISPLQKDILLRRIASHVLVAERDAFQRAVDIVFLDREDKQ